MNNDTDNRLAALEAEVAMLRARDARREAEHTTMLETRGAVEEQLRGAMEKDYELFAAAHDARFREFCASVARNAGNSEDHDPQFTIEVGIFVKGVLDVLEEFGERQRRFASVVTNHIASLTASVNIGGRNEAVLAEELKQAADAINDLRARVDDLAEVVPVVKKMGTDIHAIQQHVEDRLAGRRQLRNQKPN